MSSRQEKNGTWTSQFRYEDIYGNMKHKCKRGFETKAEADAFEAGFLQVARGSMKMRFVDFVDVYAEDIRPRVRQSTWESKEFMINNKLIPFFGKMIMEDIKTIDIIHWQNKMLEETAADGKPYSPTYLRTINNQLVAIFNHASRHYDLSPNPAAKAEKLGTKNAREMKIWTKNEYLCFSEAIADRPVTFYAFEILYWTGIRLGELQALISDDFDFATSTLSITKSFARTSLGEQITLPKTERSIRQIKIPEFLRDEINEYIYEIALVQPGERLFGFSKSFLAKEMKYGCAKTGLTPIRIHDLRHSHVSLLIDMGFSAVAIAERLGHESTDITFRYAHLFPNTQGKMADALQNLRSAE